MIMFLTVVACGLVLLTSALLYIIHNQSNKIDVYENAILSFYTNADAALTLMRQIDESKMFESDDEVGGVFQQLVDVVGILRPLVYLSPEPEEPYDES